MRRSFAGIAAVIFSLALSSYQVPASRRPALKERRFAVDLVRAINTAEMAYKAQSRGSFEEWPQLATTEGFTTAIDHFSHMDPELKKLSRTPFPDTIDGWRLSLLLSPGKDAYVVVLASTSDECSYAVVSSQDGLIRQATAIGCTD